MERLLSVYKPVIETSDNGIKDANHIILYDIHL